jgi:hypothetical protein
MGACAIAIHSGEYENSLYDTLDRQSSDLGFMGTARKDKVKVFFTQLGYVPRDRFQKPTLVDSEKGSKKFGFILMLITLNLNVETTDLS